MNKAVRPSSGFTLIELCLVMSLMGVLFAVSWPSFQSLHSRFLRERTIQDLTDCLAFARASAIAERCRYQLVFEQSPARYQLMQLRRLPTDTETTRQPVSGRWRRPKLIPEALQMEAPVDPVQFFPNGSATPATITITDSRQSVVRIEIAGSLGTARVHGL